MRLGIALCPDYDAAQLRAIAKRTRTAGQSRRLLALAGIDNGGSRTQAARVGGVGLQTIRDWGVRFKARSPEGLINGKASGNACKLNDSQRQALAEIVESGPTPAIHGVVCWRLKDLAMWVWEEFRLAVSETALSCPRPCRVHLGVVAAQHAPAFVLRLPLPTRYHPACRVDVPALHLSFRDVEELLAERGIEVTYESIRR